MAKTSAYRGLQFKVGVKVIKDATEKAAGQLDGLLADIVRKAAFDIQGRIKGLLRSQGAIDTGNLWGSISVDVGSALHATVFSNVEYAPYIEYGTIHMDARPSWWPAVQQVRPSFQGAVKAAYSNLKV